MKTAAVIFSLATLALAAPTQEKAQAATVPVSRRRHYVSRADGSADKHCFMGMGFQSIANSKQPSCFFSLVSQGNVNPTEFSFYLGRAKSGTGQKSEMTLGGRDESRYTGAFTQVPVINQGYWQVAIDGAIVGSLKALPTPEGQAAIDTGTTIILTPTEAATCIFAQIPGSIPILNGVGVPPITLFAHQGAKNSQVSLTFIGKRFTINPLDFSCGTLTNDLALNLGFDLSAITDQLCLAGIAAADIDPTQSLYVVGDTFVKSRYSTSTVSGSSASVSFAKAV